MTGVGKIIGGLWAILGGAGLIIAAALVFFTPASTKKVPQNFVCAPESLTGKEQRATIILTGTIEGVLQGQPYADVWVRPKTIYKGSPEKFVRFAAWPKKPGTANIGDLHFTTSAATYLFFFRPLTDGTLTTSSCYGTHALPAGGLTADEQAVLGTGLTR